MNVNVTISTSAFLAIIIVTVSWINYAEATTDYDCMQRNASCYVCTEKSACYWCSPTKQCKKYPLKSVVPSGCSKHQWFYKQCTVAGYWLIIVVPCVGIFLLLCLGCCIWCCCCRVSKAKREERFRLEDARLQKDKERRKAAQSQRKADRQEKVDEIRKKYGLYQHEPGYQQLKEM